MISSLIIDGALKLIQVVRYGKQSNRPDVARVFNPRSAVPEHILECSKYDNSIFVDPNTGDQYKETEGGLVLVH